MTWRRYEHTWESLAFIEADFMNRWGAFAGYAGSIEFDGFEPAAAEMEHEAERDAVRLFYVNGAGAIVRATICLERTRCTYDKPDARGRVYFRAPCCGRRVRKLALLPHAVQCGACGLITHASRRKSGAQRLIHKASALADRLECPNWFTAPAARPKHMRRETFNRLADEHARLVTEAMALIGPRLARACERGMAARMGALLRYGM